MSRIHNEEKTVSSTNSVEKLDIQMQKDEMEQLSYTIHKNQLKMD